MVWAQSGEEWCHFTSSTATGHVHGLKADSWHRIGPLTSAFCSHGCCTRCGITLLRRAHSSFLCSFQPKMRLTISELLHGKSGFSIWGKHKQPQQCRGGEIGQRLDRNSVDLHKTRLQTRRCSLENCGMAAHSPQAVEELHCVIPRYACLKKGINRISSLLVHQYQILRDRPKLPANSAVAQVRPFCCTACMHVVANRQDSITLAKRRLSHDVQAAGDSPTRATAAAGVNSTWNISSQQAAALTA